VRERERERERDRARERERKRVSSEQYRQVGTYIRLVLRSGIPVWNSERYLHPQRHT
jgi:hypothetical protein